MRKALVSLIFAWMAFPVSVAFGQIELVVVRVDGLACMF